MNEKDPGVELEEKKKVEEVEDEESWSHLHVENIPYMGTDADWWKMF